MPAAKRLTGPALLKVATELKGKAVSEVMEKAGYFTLREGKKTFNRQAYFGALSEANGYSYVDDVSSGGGVGREPTFTLKVGTKCLIPVSGCYGRKLGLEQGDHVQVELVEEAKEVVVEGPCIILYPAEAEAPGKEADTVSKEKALAAVA